MTHLEATDLAVRILRAFQGPPADIWEETLIHLNAGQTGTALARAIRTHEHRYLNVAQFLTHYRALDTTDPTTRHDCPDCTNGWTPAPDYERHGQTYTAVQPCTRCDTGTAATNSTAWKHRPAPAHQHEEDL